MKKIKKILLILDIIILIFFTIVLLKSDNTSLKSIGYNSLEIKSINKLTNKEINIIKKYDYNKDLIYIIESENYNSNNLDLYLNVLNKNKNIDYLNVLTLINHENFNEDKIDEYLTLLNEYNNVLGIIKYVNNYKDSNISINDITLSLIEKDYFIIDYIDRYINYYNSNKELALDEVIKRVNSNLDYTFYQDVRQTDTSLGMYTLVNKFYYLDSDYIPDNLVNISNTYTTKNIQLVNEAYENFVNMEKYAKKDNITIKITSAYRSYNLQSILYNNYASFDGIELADTYFARAGFSEHQLGYSIDLTNNDYVSFDEFENTKEYKWLQENAYKFGFIQRYPKGSEYITGYMFESWHYRYVGIDVAKYIHNKGLTYEEYYAYYLR